MVPYRVLVVDDSGFMRKIISDLIIQDPQFTIVATAANGQEAIEAVLEWKPDAVTLDLEMPLMNGIEALQAIMKENPTPVIMLSGISEDNTRETIKALQFGAFDFIRKPSNAISNDIHQVGDFLLEKLRTAVLTKRHQPAITIHEKQAPVIDEINQAKQQNAAASEKPKQHVEPTPAPLPTPVKDRDKPLFPKEDGKLGLQRSAPPLHTKQSGANPGDAAPDKAKQAASSSKLVGKPVQPELKPQSAEPPIVRRGAASGSVTSFKHIVAIGTSTGGPRALHEVITSLPADFPAPVLIVQHMPPRFTKSLAQRLDSFSELQVVEAEQGERVKAGVVYIAPGGYHMELCKETGGYTILLTEQPLRNGHRPSVDVLFESLTPYRELKRHAVIMTGMGSDGAKGMKLLAECGIETTIAEAEETCVVYGMPRSAVEAGCVNKILPLQHIASQLVQAMLK
ncbi:protein-glutamate methylesterase/protein-glutamine glutaminase [Paenibacillus sp. LPE1-1-1.1]|uniref:protein-glutamate methylesterase/protein-glutamine glutaminase n=1 Tax=Paenibacillus sp. LPE1-1-1.1 TaxID=3135230 RepID=UPI00342E4FD6